MDERPAKSEAAGDPFAERLMAYFYPVHYQFGMEMEQAMSQGRVDRKQGAMLWLVASRRGSDGWVRRREIVTVLSAWFEISESKVSRMLRSLSSPPLGFLELAETPESSREKMVRLTPAGNSFVAAMTREASAYLERRVGHLSRPQLEEGLQFLSSAFLADPQSTD